jgi:RNA polymerase sigma factor (sigma-70 family)
MAKEPLEVVVRHIRKIADVQMLAEATDGQLVDRFVCEHEESAFAMLLRRHGPMVLGVCRSVLGHREDAEDVFQATFLLLARKARSIRKRESVASWLHGVAYRLAVRAREQRTLRRFYETDACTMRGTNPRVEEAWEELRPLLHEEMDKLPAKYRTALLLYYWEGKTQAEVARQLGCPLGTIQSRLGRGRKLLQERLTQRGLAFSAGSFVAFLIAETASTMIRTPFLDATRNACLQFAMGRSLVSAPVAALVEGGLHAMLWAKLRTALGLLLAAGLVAGAGALAHQVWEAKPSENSQAPEVQTATKRIHGEKPVAQEAVGRDRYGDPLPPGALARLGTVRWRHGYVATSVAFSPDGKMVASSEEENWIHVWDTATGRELARLGGQQGAFPPRYGIEAVAFSPDGKRLITGDSTSPTIVVWDIATGKEILDLHGHEGRVFCLAYSPDGRRIASGAGDKTIRLWDATTGTEVQQLQGHEAWVRGVAFSPDGTVLASCGENIRLWEIATGKELHRCERHIGEVNSVAFSPDGRLLASGGQDKTIRLWNARTGNELREFNGQQLFVQSVAFSPDGKSLASAGLDGTIRLWQTATGVAERTIQAHEGPASSVAFSPDGKLLASAGGAKMGRSGDKMVRLWDVATGKELRPSGGHQNAVTSVALSADGKTVATGGQDGTVRLWNTKTGEQLYCYENTSSTEMRRPVHSVAISPDGKTLAWAGSQICLCNLATRKELHRLGKEVSHLAFSPDSRVLAAGNWQDGVQLFDVATGQEVRQLAGGFRSLAALAFSPDGTALALAQERSNWIEIWKMGTGNGLPSFRVSEDPHVMVNAVAFSPDGRTLAAGLAAIDRSALEDNLYLWDAHTGRLLGKLAGQFGQIAAVAFSPDAKMLASATGDKAFFGGSDLTIRLWEVATREERCCFRGHLSGITSLAFTPDGSKLISAGQDSTALVWDITGFRGDRRQVFPVVPRDLESQWRALRQADTARAYTAIWAFVASAQQTPAFFKDHLRPASPVDPKRIEALLAQLDSDRFIMRQHAMQELGNLAEFAEAPLRKKLQEKLTLEMRQRVEQLLRKVEPSRSPDRLRAIRAVEVLEHLGTPEAQEVLQRLAQGAPEARLTQEAKASLERLAKRP